MDNIFHTTQLSAAIAGVAVFLAIIAVTWPYLVTDRLGARTRQISEDREAVRQREKLRQKENGKSNSLRSEPKKIFANIVRKFDLDQEVENGATTQMLRRAGYRGRAPIITYLAMRIVMPIIGLIGAILMIFVVVRPEQPPVVSILIIVGIGIFSFYLPLIFVKNKIIKRQDAIRRGWPDALDLLLICVQSGMSSENAFRKVAEEIGDQSVELREELSLTTAELAYLPDRRTAYQNLGIRTDLEGVKAVVSGLMQSEKYGTPLGQVLRVLAQENRDMRMSQAEKKAAALPPKLTVPMIIFFLPVLFAIILTPAIIQIMTI